MNKRPLSITLISLLFITFGIIALAKGLWTFVRLPAAGRSSDLYKHWIAYFTQFVALLSGVLMLRRSNLGRWLLVLWLAFHVVLSFFHNSLELGMHVLVMAVMLFFLFRPRAAAYFRGE
jgi:uncharacterized membrane protein HdeD (DUF308 family)